MITWLIDLLIEHIYCYNNVSDKPAANEWNSLRMAFAICFIDWIEIHFNSMAVGYGARAILLSIQSNFIFNKKN